MNAIESGSRYSLAFTSGVLLAREAAVLAPLHTVRDDWEQVRERAVRENLLQARTRASAVRRARETVKRLSVLTDDEIRLVIEATASERAHLMWVAACRRYDLIGEFAEEVLRERFLLLAPTLSHDDFDSFVRSKALWHEELAQVKESTLHKLRSNVFRMLHEAELLAAGQITPALLSKRVLAALDVRTPSDARFFPTRQTELREAAQ